MTRRGRHTHNIIMDMDTTRMDVVRVDGVSVAFLFVGDKLNPVSEAAEVVVGYI